MNHQVRGAEILLIMQQVYSIRITNLKFYDTVGGVSLNAQAQDCWRCIIQELPRRIILLKHWEAYRREKRINPGRPTCGGNYNDAIKLTNPNTCHVVKDDSINCQRCVFNSQSEMYLLSTLPVDIATIV